MSAKLILRKQEYEVPHGITIRAALLQLGMQPEAVLPTCKGEIVNEDQILEEGNVIKLVKLISGG
ncbi:MAG TPA: hypothetical protein DEH22_17635 [Chloroflexi bacterium]|nr:hypothetical protein [Chloroflexota bacterium]